MPTRLSLGESDRHPAQHSGSAAREASPDAAPPQNHLEPRPTPICSLQSAPRYIGGLDTVTAVPEHSISTRMRPTLPRRLRTATAEPVLYRGTSMRPPPSPCRPRHRHTRVSSPTVAHLASTGAARGMEAPPRPEQRDPAAMSSIGW